MTFAPRKILDSRLLGVSASILLAGGILLAAQRTLTLEMLCGGAERIVVGEVTGFAVVNDEWPGIGEITFTDVTIRIAERWKGPADGDTLTVRVPGGTDPVTGLTLTVSETPEFRLGEKVLVFAKDFHGRPWVHGWSQGKYEIIIERVVGSPGKPIDRDILLPPLSKRVQAILRAQAAVAPAPSGDGDGSGAAGGGR
jgi:hypothetical protein